MPIYAYRCEACGHAKDVLQKISDAPLTTCPACGAEAFAKQVTAAGFQLKGSGWYATDFRGGAQAKTEPKDGAKPASEPAKPADAGAKAPDGGGTDKSGGGSAGSSSGGSSGGSSSGGGDSGSSSSGGLSASGSCGTSCGCH
jgi:putative FmdB family regulatory protein